MLLDMGTKTVTTQKKHTDNAFKRRSSYVLPTSIYETSLSELLAFAGRSITKQQESLFRTTDENDPIIFWSGNIDYLKLPSVSVIGARSVTNDGRARARKVAKGLAAAGIVVTSGLAKGVDTAAHTGSIEANGKTIAVIGTPLDKAYPAENSRLQEVIYTDHLLISQFQPGQRTYQSDFPKRNRLMAALSDASVIVEASDTSGTLHQAAECIRLGRWLFIMESVVENPSISWPTKFLGHPRTAILRSTTEIIDKLL